MVAIPGVTEALWTILAESVTVLNFSQAGWQDILQSAVENPDSPQSWRHSSTWEAVRTAVGWHKRLEGVLERIHWPEVQRSWHEHGGPTWDPWGFAVVAEHSQPSTMHLRFEALLHHPIRPNGALWAWALTPVIEEWPRLHGLAPVCALDRVIRSLTPPDVIPGAPNFWNAWKIWMSEPSPHPDDGVSSLYPASLFLAWQRTLDTTDVMPPLTTTSGQQLAWW